MNIIRARHCRLLGAAALIAPAIFTVMTYVRDSGSDVTFIAGQAVVPNGHGSWSDHEGGTTAYHWTLVAQDGSEFPLLDAAAMYVADLLVNNAHAEDDFGEDDESESDIEDCVDDDRVGDSHDDDNGDDHENGDGDDNGDSHDNDDGNDNGDSHDNNDDDDNGDSRDNGDSDDDDECRVLPGITIDDAEVNESTGIAMVTVRLTAPSADPVMVDFTTLDGTAVAAEDYVANSGTINFPVGTVEQTILIDLVDDGVVEGNEEFFVVLSNAMNATLDDPDGIVTIVDDDVGMAELSINDIEMLEGTPGGPSIELRFLVTLTGMVPGGLRVPVATQDGTAMVTSEDYLPNALILTFAGTSNEENMEFVVQVSPDVNEEENEFMCVFLGVPDPDTVVVVKDRGIGTLQNDDDDGVPPPAAPPGSVPADSCQTIEAPAFPALTATAAGGSGAVREVSDTSSSSAFGAFVILCLATIVGWRRKLGEQL